MDFTTEEKDRIRDLVSLPPYVGEEPAEQVRLLTTRPLVSNPVAPADVLAPLDRNALFGLVSDASKMKISNEALIAVSDRIKENDHMAVGIWVERAKARFWITTAERDQLMAKLQETIPDPSHPAQVEDDSPLEAEIGRQIAGLTVEELQEIVNAG